MNIQAACVSALLKASEELIAYLKSGQPGALEQALEGLRNHYLKLPTPGIQAAAFYFRSEPQGFLSTPLEEWNWGLFGILRRAVLCFDTLLKVVVADKALASALSTQLILDHAPAWDKVSDSSLRAAHPLTLRFLKTEIVKPIEVEIGREVLFADVLGDFWHALVRAVAYQPTTLPPGLDPRSDVFVRIIRPFCAFGIQRKWISNERHIQYSPFLKSNGDDPFFSEAELLNKQWDVWRESGRATTSAADLRAAEASRRLLAVRNWRGVRKYPTFQFVHGSASPERADEANRDPKYPFIRRDTSEALQNTSLAFSGWGAALWFQRVIERISESSPAPSVFDPPYQGHVFRELLAQKGLWLDNWGSDARGIFHGHEKKEPSSLSKEKTLFRVTDSDKLHPIWYTASQPPNESKRLVTDARILSVSDRRKNGEELYPAGRFDPWMDGGNSADRDAVEHQQSAGISEDPDAAEHQESPRPEVGAVYFSESCEGALSEILDRVPTILLSDIKKCVWEFNVEENFLCWDLTKYSSYISVTPLRSATQSIATDVAYDQGLPDAIRYPLRSVANAVGVVLFDELIRDDSRRPLPWDGGQPLEKTNNHPPKVLISTKARVSVLGNSPIPHQYWESEHVWRALQSIRMARFRDSIVCLRRFPENAEWEVDPD